MYIYKYMVLKHRIKYCTFVCHIFFFALEPFTGTSYSQTYSIHVYTSKNTPFILTFSVCERCLTLIFHSWLLQQKQDDICHQRCEQFGSYPAIPCRNRRSVQSDSRGDQKDRDRQGTGRWIKVLGTKVNDAYMKFF